MSPLALSFRPAHLDEAASISTLVNSAYRGDTSRQGWTTEADLLTGQRTSPQEIEAIIQSPHQAILVCLQDNTLIGCVNLQKTVDESSGTIRGYLGMFTVKPTLQGGGVGKEFIQAAENWVKHHWQASAMWMTVITRRDELIAFYERRGYHKTGEVIPFPTEFGDEMRIVKDLEMFVLEKVW